MQQLPPSDSVDEMLRRQLDLMQRLANKDSFSDELSSIEHPTCHQTDQKEPLHSTAFLAVAAMTEDTYRSKTDQKDSDCELASSLKQLPLAQRADELLEFLKAKPDHEMGLVIGILIQREVAKAKEQCIKEYEAKLEQVNRA